MKKFYLTSLGALLALSALAQDKTGFITTQEDLTVYNILFENAPQNPNLKDVPRFTLVGKEGKFYLGMGANLKMVGDFDWGAPLSNPNLFVPSALEPAPAGNRSQTLFSIGQSNIYWNFVALPGTSNQLGLFFDINFLGKTSHPVIAIHHAYLKYRGFTAGYIVSTFTDIKADPVAIDFAGPNAITFIRHPNIYYTYKFGKDKMWSAQLGLDMPLAENSDFSSDNRIFKEGNAFTHSATTSFIHQRMPDIPLFIQRDWADHNGWFRVSAIFRDLQYRDNYINNGSGRNEGEFGWGIKASGSTPICGGLSFTWQGVYGKGVASYIQDLTGEGLDLVPVKDKPGKLETVKTWGAYGTLQYNFGKCALWNATYSHVRAYAPNFGGDWGGMYKFGQYATSNLIFNVSSFAQVGVEYLWGRRMNYDGTQVHDNRIMLMLNLSI
ncbi:MAG: porin [Muribaculaceae bacterium]|nr:porin [Muribaculaceae bacterium]